MIGNCLQFTLHIHANDYIKHYQGHARDVLAQSVDGIILSFPAVHLRQFVEQDGVHGLFEIEFDQHYKFQALRKLVLVQKPE